MGRCGSRSSEISDGRQLGCLGGHDTLQEAAGLERLRFDLQPTALDAGQHQQVLDEAMEAFSLGADVVQQQRRARPGRRSGPAGPGSR